MKAPARLPSDDGVYVKLEISAQDPTYPAWNVQRMLIFTGLAEVGN